jgi:hypothetical protein
MTTRSLCLGITLIVLLLVMLGPAYAQRQTDYFAPEILDRPLGVEFLPNGHILITDGGGAFYTLTDDALVEVDESGQIVWQYVGEMGFPHSAERLADETTLVSDTANNRVFRVDPSGQMVWTSDDWGNGSGTLSDGSHLHYPNDAEVLEGGNLLITDRNNDRVIEVTTDGTVVWSYAVLNRPHNADRLPNGNTLICNSEDDLIVEVNPSGKVVWQFGDTFPLNWPRDADRLPNGNTLVTDTRNGRVLEVTPEGKSIWSFAGLALPYESDRLDNGNILIADNLHKRVIQVSPQGEIVWEFRNFPESYLETLQNGDFEVDEDGDGIPDGWYPANMNAEGPVSFVRDAGVVQNGQYSGGITYTGEGRTSWIQVVAVDEGETYQFSGSLRADLRRGVIAYQLWFTDPQGGPIGDPITVEPVIQGVSDWEKAGREVVAPAGAAAVQIWCQVVATDGRAWFDDVRWGTGGGNLGLIIGIGIGVVLLIAIVVILLVSRRGKQ